MSGIAESRAALAHPMIAVPTHDELVEQLFVRDLKLFVGQTLEPAQQKIAAQIVPAIAGSGSNSPVDDLRHRMQSFESFTTWLSLKRESQRQLWAAVEDCVERQADQLEALAAVDAPKGTLTLDPDFVAPDYITRGDIHLMPGGNAHDDGSVLQGAVMDRGGAVYMLGRNGGMLNDLRGHTAMAHLLTVAPDIRPIRILDMGCGIGTSTVPAAVCFPEAEVHGIDVGASMLRYAHARAEHLGAAVHFSQQSAERTSFPGASFDVVYSCVVLHETSPTAAINILAESRRLLRPGGIAIHLEVPLLHTLGDIWQELSSELEAQFNNEPNWRGALTADYGQLMRAAGFTDIRTGYQATAFNGRTAPRKFGEASEGVFRSWFVTSGRA
ncbi:class I SAM-dependent methyltransferase [Nitrospirillum iridis]|uniref:SAM-dependent methyltransferase n=1 Tax=Nitrospirillum iridis TaxID=765888 RepID=A0A7X0B6G3_9PROT|nr:class I SAM-dependent methyltransferase [Nitrospirillum iridis]MBB6255054.1 SAM-dependent methyltransferase [Nitrospirillum iridis]